MDSAHVTVEDSAFERLTLYPRGQVEDLAVRRNAFTGGEAHIDSIDVDVRLRNVDLYGRRGAPDHTVMVQAEAAPS